MRNQVSQRPVSARPSLEVLEGRDVPSTVWRDATPSTPDTVDVYYDYRNQRNGTVVYTNQITLGQRQLTERALAFWEEASLGKLQFTRNTTAPASAILNIGTGNLAAVGFVSGPGGTLGGGGLGTRGGVAWMDFRERWDLLVGNGNPAGTNDYYTVAAHEIGHGLGLDHLYQGSGPDVMAASYNGERTSFTARDRSAIWAAYGKGVGVHIRYETRDPSGNLYTLRDDGWLLVNGSPSWSRTKDFALDSQGRLVILNVSGLLERLNGATGRWDTFGTSVTKFTIRYDGAVFALRSDGWLLVNGTPSWARTKDFALDSQGRLVVLNVSGLLQGQVPGGWQDLGTGIGKFAIRGDGAVFALRSDGWLLVNGSPSWSRTKDFALDSQGRLVVLNVSGLLERLNGATGRWDTFGTSVTKFTIRYDGAVFALRGDGWLLVNGNRSWSRTRDFALTRSGRLYWLGVDLLLQRQTASGWVDLARGVRSIWLDAREVLHQL